MDVEWCWSRIGWSRIGACVVFVSVSDGYDYVASKLSQVLEAPTIVWSRVQITFQVLSDMFLLVILNVQCHLQISAAMVSIPSSWMIRFETVANIQFAKKQKMLRASRTFCLPFHFGDVAANITSFCDLPSDAHPQKNYNYYMHLASISIN